jgi:hypothetical protein
MTVAIRGSRQVGLELFDEPLALLGLGPFHQRIVGGDGGIGQGGFIRTPYVVSCNLQELCNGAARSRRSRDATTQAGQ